jgi:hypothetical protein
MECDRFIEEKVGESDSPEFRAHREACAGCRQDLEDLAEIRELYREASVERYRGGAPAVRRGRAAWAPAAVAAAFMVGILVTILVMPARPGVPKPEPEPAGTAFFRVHLEPWGGEERLSRALEDAWSRLEDMERSAK